MTWTPIETWERTTSIRPALGVIPPSIKSLHNSTRSAPPCCAATADATESTQTSISTCSAMACLRGPEICAPCFLVEAQTANVTSADGGHSTRTAYQDSLESAGVILRPIRKRWGG